MPPRRAVWIRLLVSPLLLLLVLLVLWLHDRSGNPLFTDAALLLVGGAAAFEITRLLRQTGREVDAAVATAASGLLAGVGLLAPDDAAARFEARALLVAATLVVLMLRYLRDIRPEAVERVALSLVPALYVGLLLGWVREVGVGDHPARMLALVIVVAKASDMGGWLVGRPFGRHKLVPRISPQKSWEGLAGGLAGSVLVALFLPAALDVPPQAWTPLQRALFGVAVGGAGVLAGLTHSAWKRRLGAKDSLPLVPEIGGVLDMIDSLLLAGPVAWLWLRLAG